MAVMLISYDLNSPGQKYSDLIEEIQRYTHQKALLSAWLIDTSETPATVRDKLRKHTDNGDHIFVVKFKSADWASFISTAVNEWLNSPLRNWG